MNDNNAKQAQLKSDAAAQATPSDDDDDDYEFKLPKLNDPDYLKFCRMFSVDPVKFYEDKNPSCIYLMTSPESMENKWLMHILPRLRARQFPSQTRQNYAEALSVCDGGRKIITASCNPHTADAIINSQVVHLMIL